MVVLVVPQVLMERMATNTRRLREEVVAVETPPDQAVLAVLAVLLAAAVAVVVAAPRLAAMAAPAASPALG